VRTIRLTEHVPQPAELTPVELDELSMLPRGVLKVTRQLDGTFCITPGSRVGTVALPSLRLSIRSKAGLRNALMLLAYALKVDWGADDFPYDLEDLSQAIAWWFDREAARAMRHGLHRDYVDRTETLTTLRGRPAIQRQIAAHPGRRSPIVCSFQEYGEDTELNRVIKAAHNSLLRMPDLDRAVSQRLRQRARRVLGEVSSIEYSPAAVPMIPLTRLHRPWQPAFRLASLILRRQALRDETGRIRGTAFLIDMNVVFQRFMEAIVRERAAASGCRLEAAVSRHLTSPGARADGRAVAALQVRPDLVLMRGSVPAAVGDAKYKDPRGEIDDVYQLVTYCVRLGLERGLLVYCGAAPLCERRILDSSLTVATIGVDLTGSPGSVLAQARAAADALIAQAATRTGARRAA